MQKAKAMQRYVILCHARSGSNYVVHTLTQHPDITAHNELFHEDRIYHVNGVIEDAELLARRNAQPIAYLESVLSECQTPVFGFKHLLFYDESIIDYVAKEGFHIIILERDNILAHYSSMRIAHQTGQWTLYNGQAAMAADKLEWDEAAFEAYRQEYTDDYTELHEHAAKYGAPILTLEYVDLFTRTTLSRIFNFLGVADDVPIKLDVIRKQNTEQITQRYAQPERVESYLARIGKLAWVEEVIRGD
jgi:LPS sulfotransferase NodH